LFATNVFTAMAFQSRTTSALATADVSNTLAINMPKSLRVFVNLLLFSLFICPSEVVQRLAVGGMIAVRGDCRQ